jgi:hypothetical protein
MKEITSILRAKVTAWNNICSQMNSSLFLADGFEPKLMLPVSNAECVFWYDITNLYALIVDCMPYILKAGSLFNHTRIKLNSSSSLLLLLKNNGFLSDANAQAIVKFIDAVKEARSCFCHNKRASTFNFGKINDGIGPHTSDWKFYSHLGLSGTFDFDEGSDLLFAKTSSILSIIDNALDAAKRGYADEFIDEWSRSIAAWYMSSNDIIFRGLIVYKNNGKIPFIKYGFSKMETASLSAIANNKGITVERLVLDLHDELTEEVIYSSAIATPENVLYRLFDAII